MNEKSILSRACPACKGSVGRYVGEKNGFHIMACRACSSLYSSTLPKAEEAEDYDTYYDDSNLTVPDFIHKRTDEIFGGFDQYRLLNRFLDIGFGSGSMLDGAKRAGWEVFGQEVSRTAADRARERGYSVFHGELEEARYPDHYFDVITASEIIEHLHDPEKTLREMRRILRPGGILWATTPFARGLSYRVLGIDWSILSPPEHLQLYSVKGMNLMLKSAGFSKVQFKTTGVNPMEIANHLRGRVRRATAGSEATFDRVGSGYRLNEQLTSSRRGSLIKSAVNGTLDFFKIGDSLKILASH